MAEETLTLETPKLAMVVHQHAIRKGVDLPEPAFEQLRLAHDLRNALLDVEEMYDGAVAEAWLEHPDVAATLTLRDQAQELVDALIQRGKDERKTDGTTRPRRATAADLKGARQALREAKQAVRDAKSAAKPMVDPALVSAGEARKAMLDELRREFSSQRGLFWGTCNDVLDHHKIAVKRIKAMRKQGQRAQLRRHRFDATGTLTIILLRQAGDPPRTPPDLAEGKGARAAQLRVWPWVDPQVWESMTRAQRRKTGRGEIMTQFRAVERKGDRVGPDQQLVLPATVHRMLPADADIALARLTRRRVGSHHRLTLSVTAKVAPTPVRDEGPAVAAHVGWRVRGDKSLRVATWVATERLETPSNVADVVAGHGTWGEVFLPAAWRDSYEHLSGIRAGRDKDLDRIKERLATWLDERGAVEVEGRDEPLTGADVRRWRSPARIAMLLLRGWRDDPPGGDAGLVAEMEAWRKHDKHLWDWEANGRKKLEGRRDDAWRRVAAWWGKLARVVVVDDVPIRELTRVPGVGFEDEAQARAARANRVVAAPGRLRELIGLAAQRHGASLRIESGLEGTARHYRCGQLIAPPEGFAESMEVFCETCRRAVDQDRNMAMMLLAKAGQVAPPPVRG